MLTCLILFASAFVSVFLLVIQSLNNTHGRQALAAVTSIGIGLAQVYLYKLLPDANLEQVLSYIAAGPLANLAAQWVKRHDIAKIKALKHPDERNLSFEGAGGIKVDVQDLLASPKVQQQVAAAREIGRRESLQRYIAAERARR